MFPRDPRLEALRQILAAHRHSRVRRRPGTWEAAVALLVREGPRPELLLIHRADQPGDPWSGHMALPGGRRAPGDADLLSTALRETEEETGIPAVRVGSPWGALDEVEPGTRRLPPLIIAPFVVYVPPGTPVRPDPREVQDAWWVPVADLADADAVGEILIELEGGAQAFPSIRWQERDIWGLTLRILRHFLGLAEEAGL